MNNQYGLMRFFVLVGFWALAGCATLSSPANEGDVLRERVSQMMSAKVAGQWDRVYTFYDPAFQARVPKETFATPKKMKFNRFEIQKVEIAAPGASATVHLLNDVTLQGQKFENAPEIQHWIKLKGTWYLKVPERSAGPFTPKSQ